MKNHRAAVFLAALALSFTGRSFAWFQERGSSGHALENLESSGLLADAAGAGGTGFEDFNPAGFSGRYREEFLLSFAPLFEGANRYSAVYVLPLENRRALWTSVSGVSVDDVPGTNELGEDTGSFGASEIMMKTGYSRDIGGGCVAAGALKYYTKRVSDYSASAVTCDLGAMFYLDDVEAGVAVQSAAPSYVGADEIRPSLHGGIKHYFAHRRASASFDLLYQAAFSEFAALKWFVGARYEYPRGIIWRAGLNKKSVSAGFGLEFRRAGFDYGMFYHPLGIAHIFTVTTRFSVEPTAAELRAEEDLRNLDAERAASSRSAALERKSLADERERLARERKISSIYLSAARDFGEKKYARAEAKLGQVLKIDPRNEDARRMLAEIKAITSEAIIKRKMFEMETDYKKGDYESVVENALWIIGAQPDNEKARVYSYLARARLFAAEKKYTDAKGELFEVIKIQPTNSEALGFLRRIQTVMDMEGR